MLNINRLIYLLRSGSIYFVSNTWATYLSRTFTSSVLKQESPDSVLLLPWSVFCIFDFLHSHFYFSATISFLGVSHSTKKKQWYPTEVKRLSREHLFGTLNISENNLMIIMHLLLLYQKIWRASLPSCMVYNFLDHSTIFKSFYVIYYRI